MAKASEREVEDAMRLNRFLEDLERGSYPAPLDHDWENPLPEGTPDYFDCYDKKHLTYLYDQLMEFQKRSGLMRVVFGFKVLMDNDVCDPNSDVLEWHPDLQPALQERAKRKEAASHE